MKFLFSYRLFLFFLFLFFPYPAPINTRNISHNIEIFFINLFTIEMSTQSDQTMTGESKMGLKQKQEEYLGEKNQGFQDSTSHQAGQGLSSKGNPKEGEKSDVYIPEKASKGGIERGEKS